MLPTFKIEGGKKIMSVLENLEPQILWKQFDEIRKIPRCSKREGKIREYLLNFAEKKGFESETDDAGNVVIKKPADSGMEDKTTVVLQGHMDMVCEKNRDVEHDFSKDPIPLKKKDDILTADGTSLGADNGVGLATALSILEDEKLKLGPIEALFTVDEETGLTGAFSLGEDMLTGEKMLNLDSEDFGIITVGCAGGGNSEIKLPIKKEPIEDKLKTFNIKVTGLKGGHSGIEINKQRGNAIKIIARLLWKANQKHTIQITEIKGGDKHNAIPREAQSTVSIPKEEKEKLLENIKQEKEDIKKELEKVDPDLKIKTEKTETPEKTLEKETQNKILNLLHGLPHGVERMNDDIPELVETSTNLAKITMEEEKANILLSSRSSIMTALEDLRDKIRSISELTGAEIEEEEPYPGWKPDLDSDLLKLSKKVYKNMFGEEPKVEAIHAGLECGIIGEKYPGMEMISIGPTIEHPHSPDEIVKINTVKETYKYVVEILKNI